MLSKAEPVSFKISKMEVSPENQISNQNLTKIKVENPESPLSKSLILERRLMFGLSWA